MPVEVGDKVRLQGIGGAYEGFYGKVTAIANGKLTIDLTHDDNCQPFNFTIAGVSDSHVVPGECN